METAKNKQPSKEQRVRNNTAKLLASASKKVDGANMNWAAAMAALVMGAKTGESAAAVAAQVMKNDFGEEAAEFGHPWYVIYASNNVFSDNEKAFKERINERRREMQKLAIEKGLAGINKPWSDMIAAAKRLDNPDGLPRDRTPIDLMADAKKRLVPLYKRFMKEERQTEEQTVFNMELGSMLVRFFKVDLSQLG